MGMLHFSILFSDPGSGWFHSLSHLLKLSKAPPPSLLTEDNLASYFIERLWANWRELPHVLTTKLPTCSQSEYTRFKYHLFTENSQRLNPSPKFSPQLQTSIAESLLAIPTWMFKASKFLCALKREGIVLFFQFLMFKFCIYPWPLFLSNVTYLAHQ